jgi:hypothetical protein
MRRAAPRVHNPSSMSAAHLNQEPLEFVRCILTAVTDPGDVIWEPFGGLASASVAAVQMNRIPCAAEVDHDFAEIAAQRLDDAVAGRDPEAEAEAEAEDTATSPGPRTQDQGPVKTSGWPYRKDPPAPSVTVDAVSGWRPRCLESLPG